LIQMLLKGHVNRLMAILWRSPSLYNEFCSNSS